MTETKADADKVPGGVGKPGGPAAPSQGLADRSTNACFLLSFAVRPKFLLRTLETYNTG